MMICDPNDDDIFGLQASTGEKGCKPVETGITRCSIPRGESASTSDKGHVFFEWKDPDDKVFVPGVGSGGFDWWDRDMFLCPDFEEGNQKADREVITLSPCDYDIDKFNDCVEKRVKSDQKNPPAKLPADCSAYADQVEAECKEMSKK